MNDLVEKLDIPQPAVDKGWKTWARVVRVIKGERTYDGPDYVEARKDFEYPKRVNLRLTPVGKKVWEDALGGTN